MRGVLRRAAVVLLAALATLAATRAAVERLARPPTPCPDAARSQR